MYIDDNFKFIGLLSIFLTWASIGYILFTIEKDLTKSISHHAVLKTKNYIIFSTLMSASLVLMYLFMTRWFIPTFRLPASFQITVILAIVLELITTFIPLTTGWKFTVHQLTSYGTALLIPVLLVSIALSSVISASSFYVAIVSVIVVTVLIFLFFFVKRARDHYLVYQSIFVAAFHGTVVAATLLR
jgi:Na+/glutamate symporter